MHANLMVRGEDETSLPCLDLLASEDCFDALQQPGAGRDPHSNKQQAVVCPRQEATDVREVQILCDEKPPTCLSRRPNGRIIVAGQPSSGTVSTS